MPIFYILHNEKIKFDSKETMQRDNLVREAHASNVFAVLWRTALPI